VLVDERAQRRHVVRVVDARHGGVGVGVVERRSEPVDVGGDRARARATERRDDVHALAGAREEDAAHRPRGYRRPMLRRVLVVFAVLVAAWLVTCVVLFVRPPAESKAPRHADVVVVLSGDKGRLPPALGLVRSGVAPVLAISTVDRTPHWTFARRLCAAGRYGRARVICFDAVPYSTQGEARTLRVLSRRRG